MIGVVMKITKDRIVVLCEDGKFRNFPHPSVIPSLGEKIEISEPNTIENKRNWWKKSKIWLVAVSFFLLVGITLFLNMISNNTSSLALVAIDMNPSIELFINHQDRVVKVMLLNDEAKRIITEKELKNQNFYKALDLIISRAKEEGYLDVDTEKKWVIISALDLKTHPFQIDLEKVTMDEMDLKFKLYPISNDQIKKAREKDLTLNKYIIYEQGREMGVELNIEELRTHSIVTTLIHTGVDPDLFFDPTGESLEPQKDNEQKIDSDIEKSLEREESKGGALDDTKAKKQEKASPRPADAKVDPEIYEFELEVELVGKGKIKLAYKKKEEAVEAKVEKKTEQGKEIIQGEQAAKIIFNLINQLKLSETLNKKVVAEHIISLLNIGTDQWEEIEISIEYTNGKEIEFEYENSQKSKKESSKEEDDKEDDD